MILNENYQIVYWDCDVFGLPNCFAHKNDFAAIWESEFDLNSLPFPLSPDKTYDVLVRIWALCEVRQIEFKFLNKTYVKDFDQVYMSPALHDVSGDPRKEYAGADDAVVEGICGYYTGSVVEKILCQNPNNATDLLPYRSVDWALWKRGAPYECGWSYDFYFWDDREGDVADNHGHGIWMGPILEPLESDYERGIATYGGCARPNTFVGILPLHLVDNWWDDTSPSRLARLHTNPDNMYGSMNLYTIGIRDRDTGRSEQIQTINTCLTTWPYPEGSGVDPRLIVKDLDKFHDLSTVEYHPASPPIHVVDHYARFIIRGGNKSLVLRADADNLYTIVLTPVVVSQTFAHAARWQKLRRDPRWQNNVFVKYMNDTNKPYDWLWPKRTDHPNDPNYKDTGWYFRVVHDNLLRSVAISAANQVPYENWPKCYDPLTGQPVDFGFGPDSLIDYMQPIVVHQVKIREMEETS